MKNRFSLITFLILLMSLTALGQEVDTTEKQIRPAPRRIDPFDSLHRVKQSGSQISRLEMARQLISQGSWISASRMLESFYAENPENRQAIDLLYLCYTELKAWTKAEMLIERQLDYYPDEFIVHERLLRLRMKMGNDSLVTEQVRSIMERFPAQKRIYEQVIRSLKDNGYDELGMEMIEDARKELDDPNLFLIESGNFYEVRREYGRAVREYFKAAKLDSATAAAADRRMAALIRYPEAPQPVIDTLKAILEQNPLDTFALKFLSETYIRTDMFAEAFESTIRLDSISGGDGRMLYNYLRRCRERGLWNQVAEVAEYLDRNNNDKRIPFNYNFYYAEALTGMGSNYEAIAAYEDIIESSPRARERAEALMEIGNIYRYHIRNYDSARIYYDSTQKVSGFGSIHLKTGLEIAALYLVKGELDKARNEYEQIQDHKLMQNNEEFINYNLAMIELFDKNYVDADLLLRKLISSNPRGIYLNDAIVTSLMIRESAENHPEALDDFSEAMFYEARLMPDSAEMRYREVIDMGYTPLLGNAMYRLAAQYVNRGEEEKSLELISKMEKDFSDDYFYPFCLKLKGDILLSDEETEAEGVAVLQKILEEYGGYPFVGEVREKLQKHAGFSGPG